jgi:hypothetical protein
MLTRQRDFTAALLYMSNAKNCRSLTGSNGVGIGFSENRFMTDIIIYPDMMSYWNMDITAPRLYMSSSKDIGSLIGVQSSI